MERNGKGERGGMGTENEEEKKKKKRGKIARMLWCTPGLDTYPGFWRFLVDGQLVAI
jgi:hypothetical protein